MVPLVGRFPRISSPPPFHSGAAPYSSRFTLIGSQDLDEIHNERAETEKSWFAIVGGTIAWPARSPDLTPLDYFLWDHMKGTYWRGLWLRRISDFQDIGDRVYQNMVARYPGNNRNSADVVESSFTGVEPRNSSPAHHGQHISGWCSAISSGRNSGGGCRIGTSPESAASSPPLAELALQHQTPRRPWSTSSLVHVVLAESKTQKSSFTGSSFLPGSSKNERLQPISFQVHSYQRCRPAVSLLSYLFTTTGTVVASKPSFILRRRFVFSLVFEHRHPLGVTELSTEQFQNERAVETGEPRENPPTNGIVRHDSRTRKSGDPAGKFASLLRPLSSTRLGRCYPTQQRSMAPPFPITPARRGRFSPSRARGFQFAGTNVTRIKIVQTDRRSTNESGHNNAFRGRYKLPCRQVKRSHYLGSGTDPSVQGEGAIRATLTRTPSASSLLRASRALFPSSRCTVQIRPGLKVPVAPPPLSPCNYLSLPHGTLPLLPCTGLSLTPGPTQTGQAWSYMAAPTSETDTLRYYQFDSLTSCLRPMRISEVLRMQKPLRNFRIDLPKANHSRSPYIPTSTPRQSDVSWSKMATRGWIWPNRFLHPHHPPPPLPRDTCPGVIHLSTPIVDFLPLRQDGDDWQERFTSPLLGCRHPLPSTPCKRDEP
ncbi:hypothetical protein PR048_029365 [Dryococelus australis]|uniref:Uncharacterized protein n=1 Tax=Dryococelus australis TaxID=614101 RepID=A0ABQ9GG33_9NEOP|nr:hypothetical protein PR048_029365 [Dryococelus australis]